MQSITFEVPLDPIYNVPGALHDALGVFGSLKVKPETWAKLLGAMGIAPHHVRAYYGCDIELGRAAGLDVVCSDLIAEAVPEVADPHPQRAEVSIYEDGDSAKDWAVVTFVTPGGVDVILETYRYQDHVSLILTVDFHRDSHYAATMVAAGLAKHFDSAFPILAKAAFEAAEALGFAVCEGR